MSTAASPDPSPVTLPKLSAGTAGGAADEQRALSATFSAAIGGALLGYVAIVAAWAVTELGGIAQARSLGPVALYTAVLGAVYGLIVSAAPDALDRIWDRALVRAAIGAVAGALAGALAGAISEVLFNALQQTVTPGALRFYFLRALSWTVFGVGIGVAGGIAAQSGRKAVNGLIGGLVGGAIGGILFNWVGLHVDSASQARLIGLVAVGTSIGAAIGVVEVARRQAWLRVLQGGLAGKEFVLYHESTAIGSSPKCQITLIKDPAAAPFHAQVVTDAARRILTPLDGSSVLVNGAPIRSRVLRSGDQLQIGGTILQYQERD